MQRRGRGTDPHSSAKPVGSSSNNGRPTVSKNSAKKVKPSSPTLQIVGFVLVILGLAMYVTHNVGPEEMQEKLEKMEHMAVEMEHNAVRGAHNKLVMVEELAASGAHDTAELFHHANSNNVHNIVDNSNAPPLLDSDGSRLHLIFSTDCSDYQHWQSYLTFHSAFKVKQPGHVTRIASGCTDKEEMEELAWHNEHIRDTMSDRFSIHFTPHFSSVKKEDGSTKGDYKFFNKPFGLKHWMEHGVGMGIDPLTGKPKDEDVIIILTDPDMLLLRPIRADFNDVRQTIVKEADQRKFPRKVQHGHPVAQKYGLGTQWRTFDLATITGSASSPAMSVTQQDGGQHYPAGPPYIATGRDMYTIAIKWAEFAPRVHAEYPYLLAEMFAYCIAAAHVGLPHLMVESLMVSNTGAGGEGWPLVDAMGGRGSDQSVCELATHPDEYDYARPSVIHFCQRYKLGDSFFAKRKVPKKPQTGFFDCESPLLVEPPMSLAENKDNWFKHDRGLQKPISEQAAKREAFMICAITQAMNDAGRFFKINHCGNTGGGNLHTDLKLMG